MAFVEDMRKLRDAEKANGTALPPKKAAASKPKEVLEIKEMDFQTLVFPIRGNAPYMQLRFSEKAQRQMEETQAAGTQASGKRKREKRDFEADYLAAMHRDKQGRYGIPAAAFRKAMIDACRASAAVMTVAKMAIFVEADTYDAIDHTPLVLIDGEPEQTRLPVPNANGRMDIRVRPRWNEWSARVKVTWDNELISGTSILNLLARAGAQVGIGEGRPFSKKSAGIGYGTFEVINDD